MEFVNLGEINASNSIGAELSVKKEPQSECFSNLNTSVPSIMAADSSFQGIKNEVESEEEITDRPRKKTKVFKAVDHVVKKTYKSGNSDRTQLPCIVNIKSSVVYEDSSQNHNGTLITPDEIPSTSLQLSSSEKTWESDDFVTCPENEEQNSSNNAFTTNVYQILIEIQSTLQDLRAEVSENSQKIDQLQKLLPQPWSWKTVQDDFNFPLLTDEQFLDFERKLENHEIASKLFTHLTSRTYTSWREMVLICLKSMLSRKVAVLYNLNGRKGTKKKFRDLNMCNILIECVRHKYREAEPPDILRRISFILAGSRDWEGSRHRQD